MVPRNPSALPLAIRCLKSAFNADCDGRQESRSLRAMQPCFTTCRKRLKKGIKLIVEKRKPDFSKFQRGLKNKAEKEPMASIRPK